MGHKVKLDRIAQLERTPEPRLGADDGRCLIRAVMTIFRTLPILGINH